MSEQFVSTDIDGVKHYFKDKEMSILHREGGPAIVDDSGHKMWFVNGKRHRIDGPAIEQANGDRAWYFNDNPHREDGPAVEYACGRKLWLVHGKKHRIDGPAVEYADGIKEWWVNGKEVSPGEFSFIRQQAYKDNKTNVRTIR